MKLKCCAHKRRVQVIPFKYEDEVSITWSQTVVHREDGSQCVDFVLRLGNKLVPSHLVAGAGLAGVPVRDDRLGNDYVAHLKRVQQQSLYASLTS